MREPVSNVAYELAALMRCTRSRSCRTILIRDFAFDSRLPGSILGWAKDGLKNPLLVFMSCVSMVRRQGHCYPFMTGRSLSILHGEAKSVVLQCRNGKCEANSYRLSILPSRRFLHIPHLRLYLIFSEPVHQLRRAGRRARIFLRCCALADVNLRIVSPICSRLATLNPELERPRCREQARARTGVRRDAPREHQSHRDPSMPGRQGARYQPHGRQRAGGRGGLRAPSWPSRRGRSWAA